jgi:hypothetical protein
MNTLICEYDSCERPVLSKGLCSGHYQQRQKGHELKPLRNRDRHKVVPCSFEGCQNHSTAQGLCATHYSQKQRGLQLTPARARRVGATCSFGDCNNKHWGHGLCNGHWQQMSRGAELKPLARVLPAALRDADGNKMCRKCNTYQPEDAFPANKASSDGLNGWCRTCVRSKRMERMFGLSVDMYRRILESQGGGCSVCGKGPGEDSLSFHIDHDHSCCPEKGKSCGACIRGLLCGPCNVLLGMAQDDPTRLRAAADYLDRS